MSQFRFSGDRFGKIIFKLIFHPVVQDVAFGDSSTHETVRKGTDVLLEKNFREYQKKAADLIPVYRDLGYVGEIYQEALNRVTEHELRQRICPACPYPEAGLEPNTGPSPSKRRAKEE